MLEGLQGRAYCGVVYGVSFLPRMCRAAATATVEGRETLYSAVFARPCWPQKRSRAPKCLENMLAKLLGTTRWQIFCQPSLPAILAPALANGVCAHLAWSVKHFPKI